MRFTTSTTGRPSCSPGEIFTQVILSHSTYEILLTHSSLNHPCRPSPPQRLAPGPPSPLNVRRVKTSKWSLTGHNRHHNHPPNNL
ncbi:BgTH12-03508 [Blumeria graminis f. sp. triticale]|uniref:BgTH12-03508 n=1 Tax=Blumeria graminis f. sp. triticale TaxID=1689686 RepID=A0A9W4CVY8_BLUGR|nr:BgTH12-03508 [Blumeria graminis f. sp. triticale]